MRPHQTLAECYWVSFVIRNNIVKGGGEGAKSENCKNHASIPRLLAGIVATLR